MVIEEKTAGTAVSDRAFGRNIFEKILKRKKIKRILAPMAFVVLGALFSSLAFPYSVYPAGTALIFASSRYAFFSYVGVASYALVQGRYIDFALCTLVLFVRYFVSGKSFCEKLPTKIVASGIISLFYSGALLVTSDFSPEHTGASLTFLLTVPLVTYFLSVVISHIEGRESHSTDRLVISEGVMLLLLLCSLGRVNLGVMNLGVYAGCLLVLCSGRSGGVPYGALFGLLCGSACALQSGQAGFCLVMTFGGAFCGVFYKKSIPVFLLSFAAASLAPSLYIFKGTPFYSVLCTVICACISSVPISELFPMRLEGLPLGSSATFSDKDEVKRNLEKLSKTFSSLSDIFYNISDKARYPASHEIYELAEHICERTCAGCTHTDKCYGKSIYRTHGVYDIICHRLSSGGLKISDLPEKFAENCTRLSVLVDSLNDGYAETVNEYFKNNGTEILASEYSAMARMLKYTSQKTKKDKTPDQALSRKASDALVQTGLRFSHLHAYGMRSKTIDVYGVAPSQVSLSSTQLASYMSEACGLPLHEPEFLKLSGKSVMRLSQKRKLRLEYSYSAYAKGGGQVNGDSVSFFESDEDYFYALISDGMGSGRQAALTSRLTAVFMEKLLTTGAHKNVTLELLNNLLLTKNDESFATVDLLEVDLFSGDACFIKAGAAPAYILRASKLYKIASATPPAGIIKSFSAESTRFTLERGDIVLMLSDGIVQSFDEAPWLCEMLTYENDGNPARLAARIVAKARKLCAREDDMTCVAVSVSSAE